MSDPELEQDLADVTDEAKNMAEEFGLSFETVTAVLAISAGDLVSATTDPEAALDFLAERSAGYFMALGVDPSFFS